VPGYRPYYHPTSTILTPIVLTSSLAYYDIGRAVAEEEEEDEEERTRNRVQEILDVILTHPPPASSSVGSRLEHSTTRLKLCRQLQTYKQTQEKDQAGTKLSATNLQVALMLHD
jgi:hypothetical protein